MAGDRWSRMPLGEFATLQRGHDLPDERRRPGSVPILGSFGITGWHNISKASGPGVTVGRSGASFGVVSYSPVDFWPLNTALYVIDFHGNDERFTYYFLKCFDFRSFNSGSAQPSLNRNFVHPVQVDIPPLPEQRAIAHILGTLDDKIELNRRMNATLEEMARALFKSWFVQFDPVRAKMEGRDTGLPAEIADLFPDGFEESELGEVPAGWKVDTVGDHLLNHDSKRVPVSGRERAKRQGPYPYHGAAGVMDYVDDYLFDGVFLLVGEDGSVIKDDGTAVTQYVWGKMWVNNHAHVLQGRGAVSTEHMYLYFGKERVRPYITGAVQPKLSQGRMNSMPFLFAGDQISRAFADVVAPLFARLRAGAEQSKILTKLRDALLPKLILGEMRVGDGERFLTEATS